MQPRRPPPTRRSNGFQSGLPLVLRIDRTPFEVLSTTATALLDWTDAAVPGFPVFLVFHSRDSSRCKDNRESVGDQISVCPDLTANISRPVHRNRPYRPHRSRHCLFPPPWQDALGIPGSRKKPIPGGRQVGLVLRSGGPHRHARSREGKQGFEDTPSPARGRDESFAGVCPGASRYF